MPLLLGYGGEAKGIDMQRTYQIGKMKIARCIPVPGNIVMSSRGYQRVMLDGSYYPETPVALPLANMGGGYAE